MTKKVLSAATLLLAFSIGLALSQDKGGKGGGRGPAGPGLTLTSPDIEDGGIIADKFTAKAGPSAVSPKLQWDHVPMGTQSSCCCSTIRMPRREKEWRTSRTG